MNSPTPSVGQLARALAAVGQLVAGVRSEQCSASTPCTDWSVRDLVNHLAHVNLTFAALLNDQARLTAVPTTSEMTRLALTAPRPPWYRLLPSARCPPAHLPAS